MVVIMRTHHLYIRFDSHMQAVDHAILNGWTLQGTEPMERGVLAYFTA